MNKRSREAVRESRLYLFQLMLKEQDQVNVYPILL